MKKFFAVFAVLVALILVVSCGGDGSKKLVEGGDSEKKAGELGGECYGNGTCNAGLICDDESNTCVEDPDNPSEQTDDNADTSSEQNDDNPDSGEPSEDPDAPQTPCNPNPCTSIANSTGNCTVNGTSYVCGCNSGYDWTGTQCVKPATPCDPNPCLNVANSTKECIETGDTTYACKCNSGYNWIGNQCQSNSTPSLPDCSSSSGTPCKDSSSGLTWSAIASSTMTWSNAKSYCESYSDGGLSGWHLPTIDELRTLLIADRVKNNCQVSETNDCLSSSCWSCSTCTQTGTQSSSGTSCDDSGTSYSDGRYSKFGDTGWFWSSSIPSDYSGYAWRVDFSSGIVGIDYLDYLDGGNDVRCVR